MSEQKPRKFVSKTLLAIGLCGLLIYLQMGGFEEVQGIVEDQWNSYQHAAVDPGAARKSQTPAPGQTPAQNVQAAAQNSQAPVQSSQPPAQQGSGAPQQVGAGTDGARPPSFDIARAEATGELVIAGKAEPGWTVHLKSDEKDLDEAVADSTGAWVMTPEKPLDEGAHSLKLSATSKDGKKTLEGAKVAQVTVPKRKSGHPVLALSEEAGKAGGAKSERAKPEPAKSEPAKSDLAKPEPVKSEPAKSEPAKSEVSKGEAARPTGAQLAARDAGASRETAPRTSGGKVGSRRSNGTVGSTRRDLDDEEALEESGQRTESSRHGKRRRLARKRHYTVNPGDSLWRIARRVYGSGASYTKIYRSNRDLIDDPNLIYPKQRFTLSR